jgi:protein pelota
MKIIKRDLKIGLIVARAENLDDLWYLAQAINKGDVVRARTMRLVKGKEDNMRSGKGEKKPMNLAIRVEKAEFDHNANKLRILGTIEAGPEEYVSLGSHHTLEIDEHDKLDILKKKWDQSELKYLKDAEKSAKSARVAICIVGDGEATLALVRDRGLHYIDTRENIGGKYVEGREQNKREFYSKLLKLIKEEVSKGVQTVIVGGPGFEKKNFADYAKGEFNMQVADTGNEGKQGVHEILKGGSLEKVLGEARIGKEARFMEKLEEELAKDGLAAYGEEEVKRAVQMGAVRSLLILDKKLRENREEIETLINQAKQTRSEFHVLNSRFEPGQKLEGLGSIAALLRYKV